jgi:aminoglycoside phosphotransferase (APT) family kinase protein
MVLTSGSIYHYLAAKGYAGPRWITDEDFHVADLSRRNHAWRVSLGGASRYIVKQPKEWARSHVATLEAEAHWYWLVRNRPEFAPLAPFGTACRAYDAENHILVLNAPAGCEDLDRYHARRRRFPRQIAARLGETLAGLHGAIAGGALEQARGEFGATLPWVLSWPEADPPRDSVSGGALELLRVVRENPVFGDAFRALRENWQARTLINGDMKFGHAILAEGGERIYFVDWEMATYGDPLWDAGAILHEYLRAWLRSMPGGSETSADTLVRKARAPIEELRPAIRAFWRSYGPGDAERATSYAAAWLIQSAHQGLKEESAITAQAVRMAQLSANILGAPADAAGRLLGLETA